MIKNKIKKFILRPIDSFLRTQAASGIFLAACAVIAMLIANSSWSSIYFSVLHTKILGISFQHLINDGLMAIFFFVIGMEIKKEILFGELSSIKKATLPFAAALGGMILPAIIYAYYNPTQPNLNGWGIPMATDIAFAIGILTLFGKRVPLSLKVFLLALAIVDDLGAVLVIALFYTSHIHAQGLIVACVLFSMMIFFRMAGIRSYFYYILLGILAWAGFYSSGVHATVAGVIIGFLTPSIYPTARKSLVTFSPLEDLIHALHPWVSFGIMPLFAFANAGIVLREIDFSQVVLNPIHQGILFGLVIGKPAGIILFSAAAVLFGIGVLPSSLKWKHIFGTAFLGGIGFTMALFISNLSLPPEQEIYSKTGIIFGSIIAAIAGSLILGLTLGNKPFAIFEKS